MKQANNDEILELLGKVEKPTGNFNGFYISDDGYGYTKLCKPSAYELTPAIRKLVELVIGGYWWVFNSVSTVNQYDKYDLVSFDGTQADGVIEKYIDWSTVALYREHKAEEKKPVQHDKVTLTVTPEQYAAWERGEAIQKPQKWSVKDNGIWYIGSSGNVYGISGTKSTGESEFGNTFATKEEAEYMAGLIKQLLIMYHFANERGGLKDDIVIEDITQMLMHPKCKRLFDDMAIDGLIEGVE